MLNGIILVDKPRGLSSNAVVNIVKKSLGAEKAGHLGTLDVEGQGLLPVTLGKGTKLFDYFLNKDKTYEAIFKFGIETDTLDLEGKIVNQDDKILKYDEIEKVIPKFIGQFDQMPPKYSAKKVDGKKAYQLARAGQDFSLKPKHITIYDLKLLEQVDVNSFKFFIHCSSGTFIRSLARDLAKALSTFATLSYIQRTRCGIFELKNAYSLESIKSGVYKILPLDSVIDLPPYELSAADAERILNGQILQVEKSDGSYKVYNVSLFLGIASIKNGKLKLETRLV